MKLDFKPITLEDKPIIEGYTKAWEMECSDLSFINLFIWGANGKMEYAQLEDVLYIKLDYDGVPVYLWTPIPRYGVDVDYKKAVYVAIDYMKEIGTEPTLRSVWAPFKEKIEQSCPELFMKPLEIAWDYVYDRESLATLRGKKLHGKRNHINKFMKNYPDFEYKKLDTTMIAECLDLYDEWSSHKDETTIEAYDEKTSVCLALKNMDALGLTGGCILLEGQIVAFTVGERLLPHMQLIHIEKANYEIEGLYPVINQQYVLHECQGVTLVNREEDMGIEGMRKAKRSYQPVKMIKKYFISTRELKDDKGVWQK